MIILLLCGLPWGHFFFRRLDIWLAHGQFFQVGLLIIFCYSFFESPLRKIEVKNYALGSLTMWLGLTTLHIWHSGLVNGKYVVVTFMPFFNFLCFILLYKICLEYLNSEAIDKIFRFLSYSVFLVILLSILQILGLDQFYRPLATTSEYVLRDEIVGVIGNPTHNAGFLALCLPLFFRKHWFSILGIVLSLLIIGCCKSASGIVVAISVILFSLLFNKRYLWSFLIILLCAGCLIYFWDNLGTFFNFNHRLGAWKLFFEKLQLKSVTGHGLGILNVWGIIFHSSPWRHAHCEPYQLALTVGLIGVGLSGWVVFEYFRTFLTFINKHTIRIASIFFGFCLLSLVSFPGHLWLLATIGMISYSFLYTIKNQGVLNAHTR